MNPRKKESKKWSQVPSELTKQIKTIFEESFTEHLGGKKLKVEGRIYPTEVLMRVGINNQGELRFHNFEVSVDHSAESKNTVSQIHIAIDAIASLMLDFFDNNEDHEMPLVWQEYPFEKQTIWLQYNSENPDLEAEANKLLGLENEESLLQQTQDELDALEIPEDEEIDTSKPKIFRVPTDNEFDTQKKKKKEDMH